MDYFAEVNEYAKKFGLETKSPRKLRKVTQDELDKRIRNAAVPLTFVESDLSNLSFDGAELSDAWFKNCDLSYASFRGANLDGASFDRCYAERTTFDGATMKGTNISYCCFKAAYFYGSLMLNIKIYCSFFLLCGFGGAHISVNEVDSETNFLESDFTKAYAISTRELSQAKNFSIPMACPDTGGFIGWKQCFITDPDVPFIKECIVKLRIPAEAKRSSATGRKCRCDRATVLEIQDLEGNKLPEDTVAKSWNDKHFTYKVGEIVSVDNFCEDRWEECAPGIHFFINRQEAVEY